MAAPGSIAQYAKLIDPAINSIFFDEYKQLEPRLELVFNVGKQEYNQEQEVMYSGLGGMEAVAEGATIPEDAPIEMYSTTYTSEKYQSLLSLTYETKLWGKKDVAKEASKLQARQAARKVERLAASQFNNGFDTSFTSYGDGVPAFSVAHTRADGGSNQSNASSNGIPFNENNLEAAQIEFEETLDDRGELHDLYADTIIGPRALAKEICVVTKSEYKTGSADNDINPHFSGNSSMVEYRGLTIPNIVIWKYLGEYAGGLDTAWFLQSRDNHRFNWRWGEKTTMERNDSIGFKNNTIYWRVGFHASFGWSDWRGNWGSKGDGAAYSS
jgi:hypothetical protein